jgi:hypothetical protein
LIASRPVGAAWLLHGLWKALDVDTALRKVLGGRRFTTDVERVLFALVVNRAIDSSSKLAAAEWASHDVAIPGLDGMDPAMTDDQAYRAPPAGRRRAGRAARAPRVRRQRRLAGLPRVQPLSVRRHHGGRPRARCR